MAYLGSPTTAGPARNGKEKGSGWHPEKRGAAAWTHAIWPLDNASPAAYRRPNVMALLSRRGTPGRGLIRSLAPTLERRGEGSRRMGYGCSQGKRCAESSYMRGSLVLRHGEGG